MGEQSKLFEITVLQLKNKPNDNVDDERDAIKQMNNASSEGHHHSCMQYLTSIKISVLQLNSQLG